MIKRVESRVGGKENQSISRTERQLDSSTSFLGDSFFPVEGKRHTKMWLCWGRQKRDWNREPRNSSYSVHLYSATHFFMDDKIPLWSQLVLFKEGALKYPARSWERERAVWRQHPLLSSKEKVLPLLWSAFPNWNEPPAFPWQCFSSARTWEKCFPRMEVTSQLTHWLQAASAAVPGAGCSQFWGGTLVLTTEAGPWLQPAFPGNPGGRGGSVVSFPFYLGFFFHFIED